MSGLSQDDFRRIMDTPLPVHGNAPRVLSGLPRQVKRSMTNDERKAKYKKLKTEPAADKPKQPKLDPTYQGKYRDRAAERRSGGDVETLDVTPAPANLVDPEIAKLVAKPALPANLDLSLLSKLKQEKAKLQQQVQALTKPTTSLLPPPVPTKAASRMAQAIKYLLQPSSTASRSSDLFLPGRLSYAFNLLAPDVDALPQLVQRSKDDCPRRSKHAPLAGYLPQSLVLEVEDCLLAAEGKRHRPKQVVPTSPPPTAAPVHVASTVDDDDDDEDIFGDVGEYIPPGMRPEDGVGTHAVAKGEIFKDLSATLTAKAAMEAAKEKAAATALAESIARAKKAHQRAAERDELLEKHARLQKKLDGEDEYGECFPDYEEDKKGDEPDVDKKWKAKVQQKEAKFERELAKVEEIMKKGPKTPKPPRSSGNDDENDDV
ncbi:hypothetical protein SPRG_05745 [Saprolegnia parasitica CBS 223.65]|uniref:RED-like N-terminal domain-containing protein n=1 Tax=Saprolegnia parasitica (strain CBS 223.65) TaxID=695850 RepID=A0A067CDP0_SAPPC|nr:hypothetical protein SPRG_05745 [Saprolegnia parasitica CBS 223.65]KDO28874.1 hypothetical protein SPRG_05745 [Saprolegnia parasitica CBS 223.65]|eukprot:XP_012200419.1 hypothetical protein SPRG_05745 [Saprolegnia parasitica CBS 223.65]